MFVIMTGSSGVGKNTVINELKKLDNRFVLMPTYTTREMREGEVEGNPYFFLTKEQFQEKIRNNQLLEHEIIHTNYYGSSQELLHKFLNDEKIVIKDIGVKGAQNLYKKLNETTKVLRVFLTVKSKNELKKRLKGRNEKNIKLRLKRFGFEQKQKNNFDYIIYNHDLQKTIEIILQIVELGYNDFMPCKNLQNINKYKVKYYVNKLRTGKILKPIKIAFDGKKAYILKGAEKFVASCLTNIPVAKIVVYKQIRHKVNAPENWFENII